MFCNFVQRIINQYGFINVVYADSAEQTMIARTAGKPPQEGAWLGACGERTEDKYQ